MKEILTDEKLEYLAKLYGQKSHLIKKFSRFIPFWLFVENKLVKISEDRIAVLKKIDAELYESCIFPL